MRSFLGVLLVMSVGCTTTGGKVFGTVGVASGVGAVYLLSTSGPSIENGQLVTQDDRMHLGAGLMFAAVGAAGAWFVSEYILGRPMPSGGGGGGVSVDPATEAEAVAVPVAAPELEPAPAPVAEPEPAPPPPPAPVVIVVPERDRGELDPSRPGWHFDPHDGQHKLFGGEGQLLGRIDPYGYVFTGRGVPIGTVDMTSSCNTLCRRAAASKLLASDPRR